MTFVQPEDHLLDFPFTRMFKLKKAAFYPKSFAGGQGIRKEG